MNDRVIALVLSESDYREYDSLYQVITADKGFLAFVARGIKKKDHKQNILPLNLYEFIIDYKENKTMYAVKNVRLLKSFHDFSDFKRIQLLNIAAEAALKSRELWDDTFYTTLLQVFVSQNTLSLLCYFLAYLLERHGVKPCVDGCVICGCQKVVELGIKEGGFLCLNHAKGQHRDPLLLKKFRLFNKAKPEHSEILAKIATTKEDLDLLVAFFESNTDLKLNAYRLFARLN